MTKGKAKTAASKSNSSKPAKPVKLASKVAKPQAAKVAKGPAKPVARPAAAKASAPTTAASWSDSIRKALQEKAQRSHGPQQAQQGGNGPGARRESQSKGPAFFQHRSSRAPG